MKKSVMGIITILLTFFMFQNIVYAESNQCSLKDVSKWTYTGNYNASKNESKESSDKLVNCCSKSDGSWVCDEYVAVVSTSTVATTSQGTSTSGGSSSNVSTSSVNVCSDASLIPTYKFIGQIIRIAKIFIPIIIIGFGMLDLFRSVTSAKPEEIAKSLKTLLFRVIAGVLIFFLPAIINFIFSFVDNWSNQYENETKSCFNCIWDVNNC